HTTLFRSDGTDVCNASIMGLTVSNAKFHVPNPNQAFLNVNGDLTVNSASDNHSLFTFWSNPVNFGTGLDAEPDYHMPDMSQLSGDRKSTRQHITPGTSKVINDVTIINSTSSKWVSVYTPRQHPTTQTNPG